jgi:membrane associated rhomboid family serine protease
VTDGAGVLVVRTTARGERSPTAETVGLVLAGSLLRPVLLALGLSTPLALGPDVLAAPWTLVTSVYAHAGPTHLLGNLVGLVLLGGLVERVSTRARVHGFVLATGGLAGLAEVAVGGLFAPAPRVVLGASGAVFALLGYAITGNALADRLLAALDRSTGPRWAVAAVLGAATVGLALLLSAPGSAVLGHGVGLGLGLLAGRGRLLHVDRGSAGRG